MTSPWFSAREKARLALIHTAKPLADRLKGIKGSYGSSRHAGLGLEASLDYVRRVFADYRALLKPGGPAGARVLELGCGDSQAVALAFLCAGAASVVCTDKFASPGSPQGRSSEERLLAALLVSRGYAGSDLARQGEGFAFRGRPLDHRVGVAAESLGEIFPPNSLDLIVSRAVLEHISDLEESMAQQARVLAPGGRILHRVDLRSHGLSEDRHPLGLLTLPKAYDKLNRRYGYPNRRRLRDYRTALQAAGLRLQRVLVTRSLDKKEELADPPELSQFLSQPPQKALELVRAIKSDLQAPFSEMIDSELAVSGIFLLAEKPVL